MIYRTAESFFTNSKRTTIIEDIQRQLEVESLLRTYSVDYVIENFDYVISDYKFTQAQLREMAPECVRQRERELERTARVTEILSEQV